MKYIIFTYFLLLISIFANSQAVPPANNQPQSVSSNPAITSWPGLINYPTNLKRNFVRTHTPVRPITVANESLITVNTAVPYSRTESRYYDYLGRPLQEVYRWSSFSINDLVKNHIYDANGRETYEYVPYAPNVATGKFRTNVLNELKNNYNSNYSGEEPYSKKEYDGSPLNRITKTLLPGKGWVGSNRGVTTNVLGGGGYPVFTIGPNITDLPVPAGTYYSGTCFEYETIDEDGDLRYEVKDLMGRIVATAAQAGSGSANYMPTYYVYDDFGRLRCVIPPAADVNNLNATTVANLCYTYFYDKKGRLIEKKLPGKAVEYFVYDRLDRLIMKQDGNLRASGNWHCYIYDVYDRLLGEAIHYNPATRVSLETYFQSTPTFVVAQSMMFYLTAYNLVRNPFSLSVQPNDATLISIHYYDDYNYGGLSVTAFDASLNASVPSPAYSEPLPSTASSNTRGLETYTTKRVQLPDGTWDNVWLETLKFYNEKGQMIQTQTADLNTVDLQTMKYYFSGEVAGTAIKHYDMGQYTTLVKKQYLKDARGQHISRVDQSINNAAFVTIYEHSYDFLGRISNKRLGGKFDNLYTYDIHGWLTGINPTYVDNGAYDPNFGPYFGERISYDKGFASKLYNGNIAGIQWRKSMGAPKEFYGYTYDQANRLQHAEYGKWEPPSAGASPAWTKNFTDFTATNIGYDRNGNITSMDQFGPVHTSSSNGAIIPGDMDKLVYDYFPGTNKLMGVYDYAGGVHINGNPDFQNDLYGATQDYDYDPNGNLIQDINKGISSQINYSIHNKPLTIQFDDGSKIEYTYDADGNKLRKVVTTAQTSAVDTWDYPSNGFVYKNNQLQYILHEEGRARPAIPGTTPGSTDFTYDFFIKDHLNNVRAVIGTNTIYVSNWISENPDSYVQLAHTYRATMEVANAGTESAIWEYLSEVTDINPYPTAPSDAKAARLNGAESDRQIGTALLLKTMPGDKIDISGYNYYNTEEPEVGPAGNNTSAADLLITALSNGVNVDGIPINELPQNMATIQSTVGNANFISVLNDLDIALNDPGLPASNLVWIQFNEDMHPTNDGSGSLQASGANDWALAESGTIEVTEAGYILIFTKSIVPKSVWWNELKVKVLQGAVLEEDHYYPFGLTLSQASANSGQKNEYKFGTKDLQSELGLHWYNFGARQYDMQTGRWLGIDPYAEKYAYETPYNYAGNNPVRNIDVGGKFKYPVNSGYEVKYRNLTSYLSSYIADDILNSPIILQGLAKYSGGNLTKNQIRNDVTWGKKSSPEIMFVESLDEKKGLFGEYEPMYNRIKISKGMADRIEKALSEGNKDEREAALYEFLGTLTHEEVHRGDYLDGERQSASDPSGFGDEPGKYFMQEVFESKNIQQENGAKSREHIGLSIHGDSQLLIEIQKEDDRDELIPTLPNLQ